MASFVLSEKAVEDVTGISNYIAARNITAAIRMVELLEQTCQMLADNPELGELRHSYGVPNC